MASWWYIIPHKNKAPQIEKIGETSALYFSKICDYNCEVVEQAMYVYSDTYNLTNFIKVPTCFNHSGNPSCVYLIFTSKPRHFY